MKNKSQGFSLIELILAALIMGIVLLCVYSSFLLGVRAWESVNNDIDKDAQKLFSGLTRQLRCAYISDKDPDFTFKGGSSMLDFAATAGIDDRIYADSSQDIQRIRYFFSTEQATGKKQLYCETDDARTKLSELVNSLSFAFYDGKQWQKGWDSSRNLPYAVKIRADFQKGAYKQSFQTIETISCAAGVL